MRGRKLAAFAAAMSLAACGGGGGSNTAASGTYPTTPGTTTPTNNLPPNTMQAGNDVQFTPSTLVVAKGTNVNFVFQDTVHQLYFVGTGKPADMPNYSNVTIQRQFTVAGSVTVYCKNHTYMTGFVVVQ